MMENILQKQKQRIIALYHQFQNDLGLLDDHFIELVQFIIEARQEEATQLMQDYNVSLSDYQAYDQLQSLLIGINRELRNTPIFQRIKIIKQCMPISVKSPPLFTLNNQNETYWLQELESIDVDQQQVRTVKKEKIDIKFDKNAILFRLVHQSQIKPLDTIFYAIISKDEHFYLENNKNNQKIAPFYEEKTPFKNITIFLLNKSQTQNLILRKDESGIINTLNNVVSWFGGRKNHENRSSYLYFYPHESLVINGNDISHEAIWRLASILIEKIQERKINQTEGINFINQLISYKMKIYYKTTLKDDKTFSTFIISQNFLRSKLGAQFLYSLEGQNSDQILRQYFKRRQIKSSNQPFRPNYIQKQLLQTEHPLIAQYRLFRQRLKLYLSLKNILYLQEQEIQNILQNNYTIYFYLVVSKMAPKFYERKIKILHKAIVQNSNLDSLDYFIILYSNYKNYTQIDNFGFQVKQKQLFQALADKIQKQKGQLIISQTSSNNKTRQLLSDKMKKLLLSQNGQTLCAYTYAFQIYRIFKLRISSHKLLFQLFNQFRYLFVQCVLKRPRSLNQITLLLTQPSNDQDYLAAREIIFNYPKIIEQMIPLINNSNIDCQALIKVITEAFSNKQIKYSSIVINICANINKISQGQQSTVIILMESISPYLYQTIIFNKASHEDYVINELTNLLKAMMLIKFPQCRHITIRKLIERLVIQYDDREAHRILLKLLSKNAINQQKRQEIQIIIYEQERFSWAITKPNIREAMINNPNLLRSLKNNKKVFQKFLNEVAESFICYQITMQELRKLKNNIPIIKEISKKVRFDEIVKTIQNHVEILQKNSKNLNEILEKYKAFNRQIQLIRQYLSILDKQVIMLAFNKAAPLKTMLQQSQKIYLFRDSNFWQQTDVNTLDDLVSLGDKSFRAFMKQIDIFQNGDISYSAFKHHYIDEKNIQRMLRFIDRKQKLTKQIINYVQLFNDQSLNKYEQFISVYCYITQDLLGNDIDQYSKQFKQFLFKIKEQPQNNLMRNLNEDLQTNITKLSSILLSKKSKSNTAIDQIRQIQQNVVYQIFRSTYRCRQLLDFYRSDKINLQEIQQLNEYLEDIESSEINLQTINQLKRVIECFQVYDNSKGMMQINKNMQNLAKNEIFPLSQCISDCHSAISSIKRMMWKAKNREFSFKIQVEEMLRSSRVILKQIDGQIKLQVDLGVEISQSKFQSGKKQLVWSQMLSYKEKSMLMIKDIQKTQTNSKTSSINNLETLQTFKQCINKLQKLYYYVKEMITLGYDISLIGIQFLIKSSDLSQLDRALDEFSTKYQKWKKFVKQLYRTSYFMTHFIGPQLSNFKKTFLSFEYLPFYKNILKIDEVRFARSLRYDDKLLKLKQAVQTQKQNIKQEYILQQIKQIFQQFNPNSQAIVQESANISILVCQAKYYYSCLLQKQDVAEITQVLICQSHTTPQQIECFIYRALLKWTKRHYIISCYDLNEQARSQLLDLLIGLNNSKELQRAKLTFISCKTNDKIIGALTKRNTFNSLKRQLTEKQIDQQAKIVLQPLKKKTMIIQSERAGLGKTFYAQRLAKQRKRTLLYFPVCGNIQLKILSQRLKKIINNFTTGKQDTKLSILIQIGMVENKKQLQVFLSQIILFRSFYYQQYIFLPEDTEIYVQIQNHYHDLQEKDEYHIINLLKKYCAADSYKKIDDFRLGQICFTPQDDKQNFTLTYLSMIENGLIEKRQLAYVDPQSANYQNIKPLPQSQSRKLIQKYFFQWFNGTSKPTYHTFNFFMKMLFNLFKAFGQSPYLMIFNFSQIHAQYDIFKLKEQARTKFLCICIKNTLQFLEQSVTTNCFGNGVGQLKHFNEKMKENNLLIVPTAGFHGYQFVYCDDTKVPFVIKSLLIKETTQLNAISTKIRNVNHVNQYFSTTAFNHSKGDILTMKILSKLSHITGNQKFQSQFYDPKTKKTQYRTLQEMLKKIPELKEYKITLDNFFKMCLIMLRSLCSAPIIIMGESGVGKTALIKFLVEVIYEQQLIIQNVHAGIHYQNIQSWMDQIIEKSKKITNDKKLWVFFDEFNTSDELSYFKQILIDKRFNGEQLPKNIIFLAACNPYRHRKQARKEHGLNYVPKNRDIVQNNLAFKVKPPSLSMIQLMWDYQQLKQSQIQEYVDNMLRGIKFTKLDKLIKLIVEIHQIFKVERQISSVSLRDVYRFVELYRWFEKSIPKEQVKKNKAKTGGKNKKKSYKRKNKEQNENIYQLNRSERAIILSLVFCYGLKIESHSARKRIISLAESRLQYKEGRISLIFDKQLKDYVNRLEINDQKIASNTTLNENLFTTLVCLNNKIPILIIGNPGSSKSLSVRMIDSHLKGKQSKTQFCQQFPKVNMFYFQGSQSSTSQGVEQIFNKAEQKERQTRQYNQKIGQDKQSFINCILFDQIGLAEKSVHNPLKVLHSKLQTREKSMGFIGISNYELDSAKMSRFLVLAHTEPDQQQLQLTAQKIFQSYNFEDEKEQKYQQKFTQLGRKYYQFINQWNKEMENIKHFFGLRDFYSFIKNVCQQLKNDSGYIEDFNAIVANSIAMNFDGQKGSVQMFLKLMEFDKQKIQILNPIEMVKKNLGKNQSRCLMLIVKSDALIPLINQKIEVNGEKRQVQCFYGSTFQDDKESEDYNLEATSKIITQLSRGTILVFKDINNSIQTSLYDLFNKSYVKRGKYKTCRIAVGANSNPKCIVHDNFNAIIYVQEQNIPHLDLPFINRFQKHQLSIKSMATPEDQQLFKSTTQWINNLLKNKPDKCTLTLSSFLINCREQAIMTLIIKLRQSKNRQNDIRVKILQNKTIDFDILMNCQKEAITKEQISSYVKQIIPWNQNKQDLIIYTYDIFQSIGDSIASLRIRQFKTEKGLRKQLESIFTNGIYEKLQIVIDYQRQFQHLNFILFLARELKNAKESNIQIIIIVQVVRRALQSNKVQGLNISYIHNYDQYFVQDMQCKSEILTIINETKTIWDLYEKLNIVDKMAEIQFQSLKCLKMIQVKQNIEQLKEIIYELSQLSNQNQSYRAILESCLKDTLSKQLIDLQQMQSNAQISIYSSNITEALETYAFGYIKNILIGFQYLIIQGGVTFNPIKIISMKDELHQKQLMREENMRVIEYLQRIFNKRLEETLHEMDRIEIRNKITRQRRLQSRILVQVPSFQSLVPLSFQDFSLIFSIKNHQSYNIEIALGKFKVQQVLDDQVLKIQLTKVENHLRKSNYFTIIEQIQRDLIPKFDEFYFYDIFMFALSRAEIALSAEEQWMLFDFFKELLEQYQMILKIVIVVFDKNLFSQVISLVNLLFKKRNFKRLIDIWKNSLRQCSNNFVLYWKTLTEICLRECFKKIQINKQNFSDIDDNFSMQKREFREYYDKCKCISRNYPQIDQFQIEASIQAFYFLIQFQQNLNKAIQEPISIIALYLSQNEGSIFLKAYKVVESLLTNKQLDSNKQLIINYLSYYLFTDWFEYILQAEDQKQMCFRKFIQLCNKYALFANNSVFYLDEIFRELSDQSNFSTILQALENNNHYQYFNNQHLTLKDNLSVAIGNYLNMIIIKTQQISEQRREDPQLFLKTHFKLFQTFIRQKEEVNLVKIFKIQFLKIYVDKYAKCLLADTWFDIFQDIDNVLSFQNELGKHIKVYIIKLFYANLKKIQIISQKFLKIQKCRWIKSMRDLISETKHNFFLPKPIYMEERKQQSKRFRRMLKQLEDTQYDIQLFHQIIYEVMKQDFQSLDCYDLLTFFLTKIYNKSICPKDISDRLKSQLEARNQDIHELRNTVLFALLLGYLSGNIGRNISFNEQQYNDQLMMLNYFNYIVSFRRHQNNPIVEMFFTADGFIPINYADWIGDRYLLGGIPHPALLRLQFIRKQHQKNRSGNSYTICSANCDYLTPIGGNFYGGNDGCAHSIDMAKCPYCGGVVGADSYNKLAREAEGARMINKQDILSQRQRIGLKTEINFIYAQQKKTLRLKGYQNGFRERQIKQNIELHMHLVESSTDHLQKSNNLVINHLISSINNFCWYVLSSFRLIDQQSFYRIWKVKIQQQNIQQLLKNSNYYLQIVQKQLFAGGAHEQFILWNLGINRRIILNLDGFQSRKKFHLRDALERDHFQLTLKKQLQKYLDVEKQQLIKSNRVMMELDKSDVIRQQGDLITHQIQYSFIRMFKIASDRPTFQSLKKFNFSLEEHYPLLAYISRLDAEAQKLQCYSDIFYFLYLLRKKFNHQITRIQSKKPLGQMIFLRKDSEEEGLQIHYKKFIQSWNSLAKSKFSLELDCHENNTLGNLPQITSDTPLKAFLFDRNTVNNQWAERLIAFTIIASRNYNSICHNLNNIYQRVYPQLNNSLFSQIKLNPTHLDNQKFILIFDSQSFQRIVEIYASQTVQYGLSKCHYPFEIIQRRIVRQLYGKKFLEIQRDQFHYFSFVGEQIQFIAQLRINSQQRTLQELKQLDLIQKYIADKQKQDPSGHYKLLRNLKKYLQNLVVFYTTLNLEINVRNNLKQVVLKYKIKGIDEEFLQILGLISQSGLANLYQLVEYYSYQYVLDMLDVCYKNDLTKQEEKTFKQLLQQLRSNKNQELPSYKQFKVALYRFAGRHVSLEISNQTQKISDYLCQVPQYWPKDINHKKISEELKYKLGNLSLQKVGSLLRLIPFKEVQLQKKSAPLQRQEKVSTAVTKQKKKDR